MLREVYLDAISKRDQKISRVKDSNYSSVLAEAASKWISYKPSPASCESAGVDSSWNKRAYQGLNLYVIDAVAVSSRNEILAAEYDDDISESARTDSLGRKAMTMEASVAHKAAETGKPEIICVDGSITARLDGTNPAAAMAEVRKYGDSIFIAKSSESRSQFKSLGSRAGDIYYYNHASRSAAGFSVPEQIQTGFGTIFEVYARLRDSTPIIRVELLQSTSEPDVKHVLDKLCYHSVGGYPYCLKLAHNWCKVSDEDIDRIASIFKLQNEHGARDPLNE